MKVHPTTTVKDEGSALESVRYDHDAFGVVTVSKSQHSHGASLFGSALKHTQSIEVTISRACNDRHLNRDWVHGQEHIVSFSMSEAQWAQFVSSIGCGTGTPVTLTLAPVRGTEISLMPELQQDPVRETFEDEIRKDCAQASKGIVEAQARIAEFLKPGAKPPSKKDLEALNDLLRKGGEHFDKNMAFLQNSFVKAMETTVAAAKTEIETFVGNLAMRTGLEALRNQQAPSLLEGDMDSTEEAERAS